MKWHGALLFLFFVCNDKLYIILSAKPGTIVTDYIPSTFSWKDAGKVIIYHTQFVRVKNPEKEQWLRIKSQVKLNNFQSHVWRRWRW